MLPHCRRCNSWSYRVCVCVCVVCMCVCVVYVCACVRACVCDLVWRQTMDIATHCIGSIVSNSAITNFALMRNFEVIPAVSCLYLQHPQKVH